MGSLAWLDEEPCNFVSNAQYPIFYRLYLQEILSALAFISNHQNLKIQLAIFNKDRRCLLLTVGLPLLVKKVLRESHLLSFTYHYVTRKTSSQEIGDSHLLTLPFSSPVKNTHTHPPYLSHVHFKSSDLENFKMESLGTHKNLSKWSKITVRGRC